MLAILCVVNPESEILYNLESPNEYRVANIEIWSIADIMRSSFQYHIYDSRCHSRIRKLQDKGDQ